MFALRMRHAVAAVTFAAVAACGGDSSTGPDTIVGSYSLTTVNGKPLPYTLVDSINGQPAYSITIMSPSSLVVNANGTFAFSLTVRLVEPNSPTTTTTQSVNGTYTMNSRTITLTANGETISGTWDGSNSISLDDEGETLVFKR